MRDDTEGCWGVPMPAPVAACLDRLLGRRRRCLVPGASGGRPCLHDRAGLPHLLAVALLRRRLDALPHRGRVCRGGWAGGAGGGGTACVLGEAHGGRTLARATASANAPRPMPHALPCSLAVCATPSSRVMLLGRLAATAVPCAAAQLLGRPARPRPLPRPNLCCAATRRSASPRPIPSHPILPCPPPPCCSLLCRPCLDGCSGSPRLASRTCRSSASGPSGTAACGGTASSWAARSRASSPRWGGGRLPGCVAVGGTRGSAKENQRAGRCVWRGTG